MVVVQISKKCDKKRVGDIPCLPWPCLLLLFLLLCCNGGGGCCHVVDVVVVVVVAVVDQMEHGRLVLSDAASHTGHRHAI